MKTVKWWLQTVYLFWQTCKGKSTVTTVASLPCLFGHLTGYSTAGYELRLYCQKQLYRRQYQRWSWFNWYFSAYRVYSVISAEAPALLREACLLDICIPAQMPSFVSDRLQKELAVQTYLDILIDRLETST